MEKINQINQSFQKFSKDIYSNLDKYNTNIIKLFGSCPECGCAWSECECDN